jgi:uncharacterized protein
MIVDSLLYVGRSLLATDVVPAAAFAALDRSGADVGIAAPMKPPGYHFRAANEYLAKMVLESGGRLIGLARVDPNLGQSACDDLVYAVEQLKLAGLFLHPWEECFQITSPRVRPVLEIARLRHLPVYIASGYPWVSEALQVSSVARDYPEVSMVATNGCQINISGLGTFDAFEAMAEADNLLMQTAGVYRQDFIDEVISRHGANRVMFASAFPYMDPALEILRTRRAEGGEPGQRLLAGGNAARLFGLST